MGGKPGPKGPRTVLTERDKIFIKAYLTGGSKTAAAIAAGASEKKAKSAGYQMAKKPAVAKAIAEAQTAVSKEMKYDLHEAIRQMDLDMAQARKDKQLSALAKMHELKMKAHGLLIERVDLRQTGFNVQILGIGDEKRGEIHVNGALPALPAPVLAHLTESDDDSSLFD